MNYLLAVAIGLVGGLTSGLFGVGGGIIMVPALVMLMHTEMKTAVATSLAVIVPTTLAGSLLNHSFGRIDWRLVAALATKRRKPGDSRDFEVSRGGDSNP